MIYLNPDINFINEQLNSVKWAVDISLPLIKYGTSPEELTQILSNKEMGAKILLGSLYWWLSLLKKSLQKDGRHTPTYIYQISREFSDIKWYYQLWQKNPELPLLPEIKLLLDHILPENETEVDNSISAKMRNFSECSISKDEFTEYINDLLLMVYGFLWWSHHKTNTEVN